MLWLATQTRNLIGYSTPATVLWWMFDALATEPPRFQTGQSQCRGSGTRRNEWRNETNSSTFSFHSLIDLGSWYGSHQSCNNSISISEKYYNICDVLRWPKSGNAHNIASFHSFSLRTCMKGFYKERLITMECSAKGFKETKAWFEILKQGRIKWWDLIKGSVIGGSSRLS